MAVSAFALAWAACSSGSSVTGPGDGGTGTFHIRANIDGSAWSSTAGAETTGVPLTLPGLYAITGAQIGSGYTLVLSLYNIAGPGTYPMGVGPTVVGGSAVVSNAAGGWATPQSGEAGTVTITALTASRIAGTFTFTAEPISGSATGTKTVTSGDFDLEVKPTGTVGPLPDYAGSKVTATLGGAPFTAAAAVGALTAGFDILTVSGSTTERLVTLTLAGVQAPGTYVLSASESRTLGVSGTTDPLHTTWTSNGSGGDGSVTVTSITATRIKGTFNATLAPAPGTSTVGSLSVVNGVFDIGRAPGS